MESRLCLHYNEFFYDYLFWKGFVDFSFDNIHSGPIVVSRLVMSPIGTRPAAQQPHRVWFLYNSDSNFHLEKGANV